MQIDNNSLGALTKRVRFRIGSQKAVGQAGEISRSRTRFSDVKTLAQGFANEVFRVFAADKPDSEIRAINACFAVESVIRHAEKN